MNLTYLFRCLLFFLICFLVISCRKGKVATEKTSLNGVAPPPLPPLVIRYDLIYSTDKNTLHSLHIVMDGGRDTTLELETNQITAILQILQDKSGAYYNPATRNFDINPQNISR